MNNNNNKQGNHLLDRYTVQPQSGQQDESPFYKSNAPSISLPKGGGALKGIDEKFSVNAVNGTAALEIPLPLSPGRSGFTPALSLSYSSGGGNSEFGLGFSLGLPSIQRRTDKQLPRYNDAAESDVFLLAGAEDLVPLPGNQTEPNADGYIVKKYRPRIEGLFARIEYIHEPGDRCGWWRVTTKDNIATYYGLTTEGRIADPEDKNRIFKWLPQLVVDHKGNAQLYEYMRENSANVAQEICERHRLNGTAPYTNTYLKRVRYCNTHPYFIDRQMPVTGTPPFVDTDIYKPAIETNSLLQQSAFLMEAVFDYGDHGVDANDIAYKVPEATPHATWLARSDAFSHFQAGFEIRTYRKCRRVLMFHHFAELNGNDLVRTLELTYKNPIDPVTLKETTSFTEADLIVSATQRGYTHDANGWHSKALPAMTFDYQPLQWDTTIHAVSPEDFKQAPQGLTGPYQWIDFEGEGISGILTEQAGAWLYKNNLGNGCFASAKTVAAKPSFNGLNNGGLQWQDLDADGRRQVVSQEPVKGYWELNDDQQWQPFRTFAKNLNIDWSSPFTKMLDLNGDGKADVMVTEDRAWTWYENLGKEGFGPGGQTTASQDENKGPVLLLRDTVQSIFLADINGDGLTDLVRIRNGEICYWPNKGYGRFGAKVIMNNAPVFQTPELYNPLYLSLADISGTGAADLIYVGRNKCTAWINLAGNAWSDAIDINPLPGTDAQSKITVLDFLGKGTGCIVWSSPLPKYASAPLQYIDLMGGIKPYLMRSYHNGMGKTVSVDYKSSTQFYLDDKKAGIEWATRLPFPVQCIATVTTKDSVSNTSYTQCYQYRHGYYDHEEREFRGFGYVETKDIETAATSATSALDQAPVLTKTWNHTGAWLREKNLLDHYREEYQQISGWDGAITVAQLPSPSGLNPQEWREAHRALKGSPLRQEVYALDGKPESAIPYSVTATAYEVIRVQPQGDNRYASFRVQQQQSIAFSCERDLSDARIAHQFTLKTDEYGNVLQSASVAYPRQFFDPAYIPAATLPQIVKDEQAKMHISWSQNNFTNDALPADNNHYRLRMGYESQSYEILLATADYPAKLWTTADLAAKIEAADGIDLSSSAEAIAGHPLKKLLSHTRVLYKANSAAATPLGPRQLDTLALPHEQYQLAFSSKLLAHCYGTSVTPAMMQEGRYWDGAEWSDTAGAYWLRSGTAIYTDPVTRFFTAEQFKDPWGNSTTVSFGNSTSHNNYWLLPLSTTDAIGNTAVVAAYDWRCLQPLKMLDSNDNVSEILYDALGMPVAMAMRGKVTYSVNNTYGESPDGDELSGLDLYDPADIAAQQSIFSATDPAAAADTLLQNATWRCVYDLQHIPAAVVMIARQQHYKNQLVVAGQDTEKIIRYSYSDGMGRVLMHKAQAQPDKSTPDTSKWIGSGRTILNNKGKAVMQFEPYFSDTHTCDTAAQAAAAGVSPKLYYDALGRNYRTELPDGTFTKTVWTAWEQEVHDPNDTVKDSAWYQDRLASSITEETDAAAKAALHYDTPTVMYTDTLARPFYTRQYLKSRPLATQPEDRIDSYVVFDAPGNRLSITDGNGNTPLQYRYNLLKQPCRQESIDSGITLMLTDVAGQPLYNWDADGRKFSVLYDELRRVIEKRLNGDTLLEYTVYGETQVDPELRNLRGQMYRHYDSSGRQTLPEGYDFKGLPIVVKQSLLANPTLSDPDWSLLSDSDLAAEPFSTTMQADALGRPVRSTDPGGHLTEHVYDKSGALKTLRLDGQIYVQDIHYDAKRQRQCIWYGNGTKTRYTYDPQNYRLTRLLTVKLSSNEMLQDLNYYYDPAGNITTINDAVQPTLFYNNSQVNPEQSFTYDTLYRLIKATGRELINSPSSGPEDNFDNAGYTGTSLGSDAVQNYTQYYAYDAVGNILQLSHVAASGSYTRDYTYHNNRLLRTQIGSQEYVYSSFDTVTNTYPGYDRRGNMLLMPHLSTLSWNAVSELSKIEQGSLSAYYQYSSGQRIRKHVVKGNIQEERIYLGSYEIYRKFEGSSLKVARETVHVSDDTGRIAMLENRTYGSDDSAEKLVRYVYSNHLQSASLELDEHAAVISYEEYHPYGTTAFKYQDDGVKATAKRYRYTGKERDEESGLYYHGARYYMPWLCRWCAVDPLESKYSPQCPYVYCSDNPVNRVDPTGMGDDDPVATLVAHSKPAPAKSDQKPLKSLLHVEGSYGGVMPSTQKTDNIRDDRPKPIPLTKYEITGDMHDREPLKFIPGSNGAITKPIEHENAWFYIKTISNAIALNSNTADVAGLIDGIANPFYRQAQQFGSDFTDNPIVRNLDGTQAWNNLNQSQSEFDKKMFNLLEVSSNFILPAVGKANSLAVSAERESIKSFGNLVTGEANAYDGVRAASQFLREQGVPRAYRKQILQSFEVETISLKTADNATFGLRFYGGAANESGRYLFPTFTNYTNRVGLALPPSWNSMSGMSQFQLTPGSAYIFGRASSQGGIYIGGSYQMYVNDLNNLTR